MEFNQLKELLEQFNESEIREFKLEQEGFQLYLNKNEMSQGQVTELVKEVEPATVVEKAPIPSTSTNEPVPAEGKTVDSPIVGVAYLSSGPNEPAFKNIGDTVAVGDTLCIVEAMKIMNEITSDVAGTVTEVLVKNEDVVEYGQPLFRIV